MIKQEANYLRKFYILLIFTVLTLPLLAIKPLFYPSEFAKSAVFLALFPVLLSIFIYQIFFRKNLKEILKVREAIFDAQNAIFMPFWLIVFYWLLLFFSTLFSLDIKYSLWSSPLRGGGFVVYSFLIFFSLLLFSILKPYDWQKIWDYIIGIGVAASLITVFQKFGIFSNFLVAHAERPSSTFGNSISLSLFLVPLVFFAVSLAIFKKNKLRKIFYAICAFLYCAAIFLTATKAAFLGLAIGFLFFAFLFPSKSGKIIRIKIIIAVLAILVVFGTLWLNSQPKLADKLSENKIIGESFSRVWFFTKDISFEKIFASRASGWQVASEAIKARPIFGYGPENFSIAFDRYYDPNLPGLEMADPLQGRTTWWDKAHSFFFEISSASGIPALVVYLSIFAVIFWRLQKIKNKLRDESLLIHGVQAAVIGYLVADFFSFDSFSTNLMAFLIIAFSLFLIKKSENSGANQEKSENKKTIFVLNEPFWKYLVLFSLFIFTLIFIWSYSIKPLSINKDINKAIYWAGNNKCGAAIKKAEDLMKNDLGIMDVFIRLSYLDILGGPCLAEKSGSEKIEIYYKGLKKIKELMILRPAYTRIWLFHMMYAYDIIENDKNITEEAKEQLGKEAIDSLDKAIALSPKRQPIFIVGAKLYFNLGKYGESEKMIQDCIKINPDFPDCYWAKAIIQLKHKEIKEATETIKFSIKNGFFDDKSSANKSALAELINLYTPEIKNKTGKEKIEHYELLAVLYQKIIAVNYQNIQYHAASAYIYKELGRYEKAREEAGIVLELSPESKKIVEDFLNTLPR